MAWWQRQFGGTTRGHVVALLRRGRRSVEELATALGLTDNAVRAQLTTLERDGLVNAAGVRRPGTAGKPATLYEVAPGAEVLFSNAYAPALAALVAERADPAVRPDAVGAGLLASAAADTAAHLVEVNLAMRPGDERIARAAELVSLARNASDRALAADG
jgi:predicted ArsR family transcriptional regulator